VLPQQGAEKLFPQEVGEVLEKRHLLVEGEDYQQVAEGVLKMGVQKEVVLKHEHPALRRLCC
jgi:hypothetical protein